MTKKTKHITKTMLPLAIMLVIVIAGVLILSNQDLETNQSQNQDQKSEQISPDKEDWQEYTNSKYGFKLKHPENWTVQSELIPRGRVIRIAPTKTEEDIRPGKKTQVLIYPQGLHTEGISGPQKQLEFIPHSQMKKTLGYTLENGEVWAKKFVFGDTPDYWENFGFISTSSEIKDLKVWCERDGEKIDMEKCDPLTSSDKISRTGEVNKEDRKTIKEIMKTLEFIDNRISEDFILNSPTKKELMQNVSTPLTLNGEAKGSWFFEGEFSVEIQDSQGETLDTTQAKAQEEWTTEGWVEYEAELSPPEQEEEEIGTLIFEKANPSGLEKNAKNVKLDVTF